MRATATRLFTALSSILWLGRILWHSLKAAHRHYCHHRSHYRHLIAIKLYCFHCLRERALGLYTAMVNATTELNGGGLVISDHTRVDGQSKVVEPECGSSWQLMKKSFKFLFYSSPTVSSFILNRFIVIRIIKNNLQEKLCRNKLISAHLKCFM